MNETKLLMALLPVIFMFHDFEEIIMFKPWLTKNKSEIEKRFPKLNDLLNKKQIYSLSTSAFAVAVLHEFILISIVAYLSLWYSAYYLWFAAFSAYFIHLLVHIGQWIIWRKYVPVIISSIITLPYCIYTLTLFIKSGQMNLETMLLWALIGVIITLLSFPSAFYFALKFNKWKSNYFNDK